MYFPCAVRISAASFESSIYNAKQKTTHASGAVSRKRLAATVSRYERACKRIGEPSVTFCGKEPQRNKAQR